jgi:hypothetical protein
MKRFRLLSRTLAIASLVLMITACSQAITPVPAKTSTVVASTPTTIVTPQPALSPSPTIAAPAPLGLAPNCPSSATPRNIAPAYFGAAVGSAPAWAVDFAGSRATLLFGENHTMYSWVQYDQHGWGHKFLWVLGPSYSGKVTFHGANLSDGSPLWLDADNVPDETTSLVLDTRDPTVVNRPGNWVEFPGGLDIAKAGCYYLQADWPGGSWRITFSAGV